MGREAGGTQKAQGRGRGAGLSAGLCSLLLPSDLGPVLLLEIKCPSPPRRPTLRLWAHGHDGTSVGWALGSGPDFEMETEARVVADYISGR